MSVSQPGKTSLVASFINAAAQFFPQLLLGAGLLFGGASLANAAIPSQEKVEYSSDLNALRTFERAGNVGLTSSSAYGLTRIFDLSRGTVCTSKEGVGQNFLIPKTISEESCALITSHDLPEIQQLLQKAGVAENDNVPISYVEMQTSHINASSLTAPTLNAQPA